MLQVAAGLFLSADPETPSGGRRNADLDLGRRRPDRHPAVSADPWRHQLAWACASADWLIRATSATCRRERSALTGLDVWIVDALRYRAHPSHFSVADALTWIDKLKPQARDPDPHAHRPRLWRLRQELPARGRAGIRRHADRAGTLMSVEFAGQNPRWPGPAYDIP